MADEATRQAAKGKCKEVEAAQEGGAPGTSTAPRTDTGTSLPRIAQSAAALPSLLLSGPPGAGLGGNEKGESSRAGEALGRAGESSVQLRSKVPGGGECVKPRRTEEHIAQEDASFAAFLDSDSVPMLSQPSMLERAWQSASVATRMSPATTAAGTPSPSVVDQEARDGADVVALLAADDLDPVFDPSEPAAHVDLPGLRKALFGEEADNGASSAAWDNVLNFIPGYIQRQAAPEHDRTMHLGTADPDEAWQQWINQWSRLLTDYQEEVWGDLSALVEEARTEVQRMEEVKPSERPPQPTALLRLRAILGHLRGAQ
ncbi:hypothetical protein MMYC01_201026 [Madurella mycetomatis]|uniref:Uncharacterized protein n=1 Tax=Madurella mycetomatis TaxID=100816 RepID=A0A175WDS6_9PEZI|nr:hypothetical protein MMYC01_201026 [Madurella mycetomatis]